MLKSTVASTMKLKLVSGKDANDNPTYTTRSFKDINVDLADDDMLSIGTAMAALQSLELGNVIRQDTSILVN